MLHVSSGVHRSEILVSLREQLKLAVLVLTKGRRQILLDYNISAVTFCTSRKCIPLKTQQQMLQVEGVCLLASWLSGTKELPQDQVPPQSFFFSSEV